MIPPLAVNSCVEHGEFALVALPFVAVLYVFCLYLWAKYREGNVA